MADIDSWVEAQEFQITLDAKGRIIDCLDNEIKRPNTPEERIRQKMIQIIHIIINQLYNKVKSSTTIKLLE